MSLGVHALNIGVVVLPLAAITGTARRIRTDRTTHQQTRSSTNSRALTAANRSTGNGANRRTNSSTADGRLIGRLLAGPSTDLSQGKVTTNIIVSTEAI